MPYWTKFIITGKMSSTEQQKTAGIARHEQSHLENELTQ